MATQVGVGRSPAPQGRSPRGPLEPDPGAPRLGVPWPGRLLRRDPHDQGGSGSGAGSRRSGSDASPRPRGSGPLRRPPRGASYADRRPTQLLEAAAVALRLPRSRACPGRSVAGCGCRAPRRSRRRDRTGRSTPSPRSSPPHRLGSSRHCLVSGSCGLAPTALRLETRTGSRTTAAAYRASGLVPAEYSSAGRSRGGQHISREGSVELRTAIIELGRGLAGHDPDFAAYRQRLQQQRQDDPWSPRCRWPPGPPPRVRHAPHPRALRPRPMGRRSGGRARHGEDRRPAHQNDVTRPPAITMDRRLRSDNNLSPPGELDGGGRDQRRFSYAAARRDCAASKTPGPSQRASAHVVA